MFYCLRALTALLQHSLNLIGSVVSLLKRLQSLRLYFVSTESLRLDFDSENDSLRLNSDYLRWIAIKKMQQAELLVAKDACCCIFFHRTNF
jgi:hypothetical protein